MVQLMLVNGKIINPMQWGNYTYANGDEYTRGFKDGTPHGKGTETRGETN